MSTPSINQRIYNTFSSCNSGDASNCRDKADSTVSRNDNRGVLDEAYSKTIDSVERRRDSDSKQPSITNEFQPIEISPSHHVLFKLPYIRGCTPKPFPEFWSSTTTNSNKGFVKMPCSEKIKQYDKNVSFVFK